ncbi:MULTISPECIES: hypothetical protein [Erwinia]|uniref:hypothetical protein n=1 Tax=Erwinia TaxID=551 RepID=UPI000B142FC8|nr:MULTISPECIES: hypothetical protein [Erwinia]
MKKINAMIFASLMAVTGASFADDPCQISAVCQGSGIPQDPCQTTTICQGS